MSTLHKREGRRDREQGRNEGEGETERAKARAKGTVRASEKGREREGEQRRGRGRGSKFKTMDGGEKARDREHTRGVRPKTSKITHLLLQPCICVGARRRQKTEERGRRKMKGNEGK